MILPETKNNNNTSAAVWRDRSWAGVAGRRCEGVNGEKDKQEARNEQKTAAATAKTARIESGRTVV